MPPSRSLHAAILATVLAAPALAAQQPPLVQGSKGRTDLTPQAWLTLPRVGDYTRAPLHIDPIEAQVARGEWVAPEAGSKVAGASGEASVWRGAEAPRSPDLAGGYAYAEFDSPADSVVLVEAPGCAAVCVNGDWVPGDPYRVGWFRVPLEVTQGSNWVLAHLAVPNGAVRLARPNTPVRIIQDQTLLPDVVAGEARELIGSVLLQNATNEALDGARLRVAWTGEEPTVVPVRTVDHLLVTPIRFPLPPVPSTVKPGDSLQLRIELLAAEGDKPLDAMEHTIECVAAADTHINTCVSAIDGSLQPYAVKPATGDGPAGIVVVLHDAGESAADSLTAFEPRADTHFLAPHGRGRWGFDWEDWSRQDAIEALDDFTAVRGEIDPQRVSVIGRGMGGHGALRLATLGPDRFAACGVVDGWISFFTQGRSRVASIDDPPIKRLLARPASAADPLRVLENLGPVGVSLLHTAKSRVSVDESRYLREALGEFHKDFAYREATAGAALKRSLNEQVDWLAPRRLNETASVDALEVATPDPAKLDSMGWVSVLAAEGQGEVARVQARRDRQARTVEVTAHNAERIRLNFEDWQSEKSDETDEPIRIRVNAGEWTNFTPGRGGKTITLARNGSGDWEPARDLSRAPARFQSFFKSPNRGGSFKSAFCCRPLLVYGTRGSEEEQRWAEVKARYDAHLFLYRGAGRLEVAPDTRVVAALRGSSAGSNPGAIESTERSLILYGNRATNSAWIALRREAMFRRRRTVRLDSGLARIGARPESGDDLAMLAVRPRVGSRRACLGVVGGTGPVGMRMTTRLRYFWSGIHYPDLLLFGSAALDPTAGATPSAEVRAAGYFDQDWGVDSGGILWRDPAI